MGPRWAGMFIRRPCQADSIGPCTPAHHSDVPSVYALMARGGEQGEGGGHDMMVGDIWCIMC